MPHLYSLLSMRHAGVVTPLIDDQSVQDNVAVTFQND